MFGPIHRMDLNPMDARVRRRRHKNRRWHAVVKVPQCFASTLSQGRWCIGAGEDQQAPVAIGLEGRDGKGEAAAQYRDVRLGRQTVLPAPGMQVVEFLAGADRQVILGLADQTNFVQMCLASLLGGFLGILFLIPFRRYFVKDMHGEFPFPEATASTEELTAGAANHQADGGEVITDLRQVRAEQQRMDRLRHRLQLFLGRDDHHRQGHDGNGQ